MKNCRHVARRTKIMIAMWSHRPHKSVTQTRTPNTLLTLINDTSNLVKKKKKRIIECNHISQCQHQSHLQMSVLPSSFVDHNLISVLGFSCSTPLAATMVALSTFVCNYSQYQKLWPNCTSIHNLQSWVQVKVYKML